MSSLIPRLTEPATAYDVLTMVCGIITEEPKRYNQEHWHLDRNGIEKFFLPMPACETVCCVAGWTCAIVGIPWICMVHGSSAANVLGLNATQAWELFNNEALDHFAASPDDLPHEGTRAYAALGVRHIQSFQERYAEQLKATIVRPIFPTSSTDGQR